MEWFTAILLAIGLALVTIVIVDSVWWYGTQRWPPSPFRFPLIGTPLQFINLDYKTFIEYGKKYGRVYSIHLLNHHFVVLNDWRVMKEALIDKSDVFASKPPMNFTKKMMGYPGILVYDGQVWKEKRRFTLYHLRNFGIGKTVMEDAILDEVAKTSELIERHFDGKRTMEMEINELFYFAALNVLWQIIGGRTYEYDDVEIRKFSEVIKDNFALGWESVQLNFMPLLVYLPFDPFHVAELVRSSKLLHEIIEKQVDEHARTLKPLEEPRDYIDAYLIEIERKKAAGEQTGADIYRKDHLMGAIFDMFQAGVETTMTTMEWALLYMATWPEIQTKVQEEIDSVIGRNRKPRYSDNLELPYTRATIMEVQRYSTVIPLCSPRMTSTATQLDGYHVPKGAIIVQNLWAVHHDEAYWGDPEVFRPSRFLDEQGQVKKYDNFIPFSTGPRFCLGESMARMELFLYFACMLHAYTFRCRTGYEPPSLEPVVSLTLRPQTFKLTVIQRT